MKDITIQAILPNLSISKAYIGNKYLQPPGNHCITEAETSFQGHNCKIGKATLFRSDD